MIARVAVWEPMPQDDRQWVIDAAKSVPGVLNGYHLLEPETGNGLSIAFFEDNTDIDAVTGAIAQRAGEMGWNDVERPRPKSMTMYKVLRHG